MPSTLNLANEQQIVDVFNHINEFRVNKGLEPVNFNVTASEVAEDWSDHMAETKSFYHNPGYGSDPRVAHRWSAASEIIAARWDTLGEGLVVQWDASPGHNSVMSDPRLKTIGVGISITGNKDWRNDPANYTMYGTVNFFAFATPPAGTYATAQDYFDGKPSLDAPPLTPVTTQAPVWDDATGTYRIPSITGVDYFVNGTLMPPGEHHSQWSPVNIEARAQAGYKVFGGMSWSHTFTQRPTTATPGAVVFTDPDGTRDDTYTVPATSGIEYLIGDRIIAAGTYPGTGTVTVTARATTGYVLAPSSVTEWTTTFKTTPAPYAPPAGSPFTDVSTGQQFYKEMSWLASTGISTGWAEADGTRTYRALQPVNRDAMAAFLYRAAGSPAYTPPAVSPFADISTGQQFYKEMSWLASTGISTGWAEADGTRTYRALQPVNRDAMAAFLYRAAGSPAYTPPAVSPFADISTGQQFYKEMSWLASTGISTGWAEADGTRTYRALQPVNRDAMAAFLYRADGTP
ncbi:CAP domain-containing protein [Arthrobacter sp. Soc17.1.1.1]|uniref:CAP domain-containing protein n=1 Tax=Arthrobacter sp. Soc17.1.1.1 TaxID=3121277 RepID=UPI002FE4E61F